MTASRSIPELLAAKRDGATWTPEEAASLVGAVTRAELSEAQVGALCMAVYLQGMDPDELVAWTHAMAGSGATLAWDGIALDKHSTGGVGDKSSLVIAPLLAELGFTVPMLSGRSLGHTGGTLDKLEAVAGFRAELSAAELRTAVRTAGCAIAAASTDIAPADRTLYRVRDETSTVSRLELIASSIVSKKLAGGAHALVLDVKAGAAAFLPDLEAARRLAAAMVELCAGAGLPAVAAVTRMDVMTGRTAGNAAEVAEAIEVLQGAGDPALRELCLDLAGQVAALADPSCSRDRLAATLASGAAYERFARMLVAQGADPALILASPTVSAVLCAPRSGTVWFDALALARTSAALGSCRQRAGEATDPSTGLIRLVPECHAVQAGEPLLELRCADQQHLDAALALAPTSVRYLDEATPEFGTAPAVLEWIHPHPTPTAPEEAR